METNTWATRSPVLLLLYHQLVYNELIDNIMMFPLFYATGNEIIF